MHSLPLMARILTLARPLQSKPLVSPLPPSHSMKTNSPRLKLQLEPGAPQNVMAPLAEAVGAAAGDCGVEALARDADWVVVTSVVGVEGEGV